MADQKPTSNYYSNLGGVNQKASQYEMSTAQFLDIRNLDFDAPKALQKRPGSTFAIGSSLGTSGPINALFEYIKLDGSSQVIAASDTAIFYVASNAFTLLAGGWNNGQPVDMLTFVNKLWMANGQSYAYYDGTSFFPAGYLSGGSFTGFTAVASSLDSGSSFAVAGMAHNSAGGSLAQFICVGIWAAYSSVRADGYYGPIDFYKNAQQLVNGRINSLDTDYFLSGQWGVTGVPISGFSAAPGATAIAIWLAMDRITHSDSYDIGGQLPFAGLSEFKIGNGIQFNRTGVGGLPLNVFFQNTLAPNIDVTQFKLYTLIPPNTATFLVQITNWSAFVGTNPQPFSAMAFNFFATYTPKYLEQNQNIMFMAGFSAKPSTVWFSDVGFPESIQPEYNFEVRTNDGDRILGMKSFNNYLLIFKEHSFHKLIGDTADNFQLVQLSTDYGCLSNRTAVTVDQKCFWLDKKGIIEFNGANWQIISSPIEGIFRRMNISAAKEKATAVHHLYRNQIWFGIPIDGSTQNNITIVYDYLVNAWTFFDGYNPASYAYIKGALNRPTVWRGDYSGMIHYTGESFFSDSGQGITCLLFSRYENEGGENQTTIWRRFFLDVATASGVTGQIKGQVYSNYDSSTVQATFAMYQAQFQTRAEMGVVGKAIAVQLSHSSASLPLRINGYGWAKRGLRNV